MTDQESEPVAPHGSLYVYVGWTEQHGLTIQCRECGGLGELPRRPGLRCVTSHSPECVLANPLEAKEI